MSPATRVHLTHRAVRDLQAIHDYSVSQWGGRTAKNYLNELQAGLDRIQAHPDLPTVFPEIHASFKFYRVNQHLLVCDIADNSIVIVTILHASMDLVARLSALQPGLTTEVHLLHARFRGTKDTRRRGGKSRD